METKVVITIDTEPDNQWDPALRKSPQFNNISELNKLQKLFDKFHASPTYLAAFSVVNDDTVSVLKDIAKSAHCEVGTHLHSWDTPPFSPPINGNGTYLHQFDSFTQRQKMINIDGLITDVFGIKPRSYRGGRYSFDDNTVSLLAECGYYVDTSVTPYISWEDDGGTNFKKFSSKDYFLTVKEKMNILEVPVSIRIKTKLPRLSKFAYLNTPNWAHAQGILRRIADFNIVWLDPSFNSFDDMRWLCDKLLAEKSGYINIMFHSSVIIPGGSPYTNNEQETKLFFQRLERLLDYLFSGCKLESFTLNEFYRFRKDFN